MGVIIINSKEFKIEFRKANNYHELEGVTTIPDECREVDRILSPAEAHCTLKKT